jgi:hypothetical protein
VKIDTIYNQSEATEGMSKGNKTYNRKVGKLLKKNLKKEELFK